MFVLIKVYVDHENENAVLMLCASESYDEIHERMDAEWHEEMAHPSQEWVTKWDDKYSYVIDVEATCQVETLDWAVHWYIFDTDRDYLDDSHGYQGFYFI